MRRHVWAAALIALLCSAPAAHAFLGFGDVSFDPAAHAELVKLYVELLHLYRLAREQVRRAQQIRHLLEVANRTRRRRHPGNLGSLIFALGQVSGAPLQEAEYAPLPVGPHLRRAYAAAVERYRRAAVAVQGARNAVRSLDSWLPAEQKSSAIAAQSTSALVAFAAARDARRRAHALLLMRAESHSDRRASDLTALYQALGPRSW